MPARGRLAVLALLVAAFMALEGLEYAAGRSPLGMSPWDPSAGLVVAAVLLGGPAALAALVLGQFLCGILVTGLPPAPQSWLPEAALSVGLWGVTALALRPRLDKGLARQGDLVLLMAAALLTAAVGTALRLMWMGAAALPLDRQIHLIAQDWISEVIGVLVVAPAILVIRPPRHPPSLRVLAEVSLLGGLVAGLLWLIFQVPPPDGGRMFYLLILPAIWAAARFGLRGAVLINLVVQLGATGMLLADRGGGDLATGAQMRMLTHLATALLLGAAISQSRRAEVALRLRQDQLARTQLLSTTGEMAAALAHELNQPLAATITYARAAQRLIDRPDADAAKIRAAMDGAVAQAERAGVIMKTLREFIGHGLPQRSPCAADRLLADAAALTQADCARAGIRLEVGAARGLPTVLADEVQVQQVLTNLIRNAMESLDLSGRPYPVVTMRAESLGRDFVQIEVADSGPGMAQDQADRLFQPFSTTKADGMGLGLSISRTIIESHGGHLWLAANGPRGCIFRFTLPTGT
jgi:signal transduction histidine kinase